LAFDPSNDWFCTGSSDRTIKLWDTGSGQLKLTLTGHIEQVTGLAVSPRHPYMFSCSLDKEVKCWDLEHNKVTHQEGVAGGPPPSPSRTSSSSNMLHPAAAAVLVCLSSCLASRVVGLLTTSSSRTDELSNAPP
jgi:WD40 repeat protein